MRKAISLAISIVALAGSGCSVGRYTVFGCVGNITEVAWTAETEEMAEKVSEDLNREYGENLDVVYYTQDDWRDCAENSREEN